MHPLKPNPLTGSFRGPDPDRTSTIKIDSGIRWIPEFEVEAIVADVERKYARAVGCLFLSAIGTLVLGVVAGFLIAPLF